MKAQEVLDAHPQEFTVKDVVAAKKWFKEPGIGTAQANGVYATVKDGKILASTTVGGCHGSLPSYAPTATLLATTTKQPIAVGCRRYNTLLETDPVLAERWLSYILNDNYFSPFYVNTSLDDAMTSGFLIPLSLPSNLALGCAILTRHQHEKASIIRAWDKLISAGVSPDLAYIMCFGLGVGNNELPGYESYPITFQTVGHNALTFVSPECLKGLLNRDYNNFLTPYSKAEPGSYHSYGMSSIIPYKNNRKETCVQVYQFALADFFATMLKGEKPSVGPKPIVSPFAKKVDPYGYQPTLKTTKGNEFPLFETVLKFAKEFERFLTTEYLNV